MRRLLSSLVAVAGVAALGALLGVAWEAVAPRVALVVAGDGKPYPEGYQPEGYVAGDGIAAVLCLAAGVVVGLSTVWVMRRAVAPDRSLLAALAAAVVLGCVGAAALWWTGHRLGDVDLDALVAASVPGDVISAPLRLRMPGVLVLWPLASVLVVFLAALSDWWRYRQPRRPEAA